LEFKLNKIDTDIRKKMQEEIKEDKVHSGKGINVKKDLKNEDNNKKQNSTKEENRKRYITINGVKYNDKNIDIKVEKVEEMNDENSKGRVLDATK
jgi:FtsP/CotA-like multicopper oxidase with cupredoxin domain